MSQSYVLWPHMTVAKNVAFGLEISKGELIAIAKPFFLSTNPMICPHRNLLGEQIQTPVEKQMSFFVDPTSETHRTRVKTKD